MSKMTVPRQKALSQVDIDTFLGADLTNNPAYVSLTRSPSCPNVIRESSGKIRKWIGYRTIYKLDGAINGCHAYVSDGVTVYLYHAGTKLYIGNVAINTDMADHKSQSRQLNGNLYIFDGKGVKVFYQEKSNDSVTYKCVSIEEMAYVPTIFISKSPQGGGEPYEPINLIQPKKVESFLGNNTDKTYQLAVTEIDSVDSVIEITADGEKELVSGTDYTVDLDLGTVTFTSVKTPVVTGEDNIRITYSKDVEGYADRINKCDICTLYGVNGARDRLFCAGNGEFGNRDYYSQLDNGLYFGDLWYTVIGADNSNIVGYSIINDKLATHLDRSDDNTNIVLRTGGLSDGEAAFVLAGSYQGSGAISKYAFSVLQTEPLFLASTGIYAVTPSDILGERYAQLRSYYLNGLLLQQNLKDACACVFDNFYMLAAGEYIFALDGTQATREKNEPYSNRQYAGFYRTNVNATAIWVQDDILYFGCADGSVKAFYTDYQNPQYYNDDGEIIVSKWTTPHILGKNFFAKKQFKKVHVLLTSAYASSLDMYAISDGNTTVISENEHVLNICTLFQSVNFRRLTFIAQISNRVIEEKISIKPEYKAAQFIFENKGLNESWSIYNISIQFIEK